MIKENLIDIYVNSFKKNWDQPAFSDFSTGTTIYYKDYAIEIAKLHLLFDSLGLKKGDKITLTGKNNIPWCITYIATIMHGLVIVPILQDFNIDNINHIINHSDSKVLFLDRTIWTKFEINKTPNIKVVFSIEDMQFEELANCTLSKGIRSLESLDKLLASTYPNGYSKEDINYAKVDNSELVLLNYTSGTTGFSKGVMLSANNLAGNITYAHSLKLLFSGQNILSFLPLAHAYGCAFEFLYALSTGAHITLLGKAPAPNILLDAFAKVKPSLIISVPLIIEKIYKSAILPKLKDKKVKLMLSIPLLKNIVYKKFKDSLIEAMGGNVGEVIIGGASLNPEVESFLYKIKFPFTVGYGMTECAPLICYDHNYEFVPTSCGRILYGIMEGKIDSEDPLNIPGEILVKGENVMMGYYKNEKATQDAFTKDGWLKTGDLGTIDQNNRVYIRGRSKNMILSASGQNIYPEEIESIVNNLPYVVESVVVQRGSKLVALVFPDYEILKVNNINFNDLPKIFNSFRSKLNKQLNTYENISSIELVEQEFEKTPKKSIKRYLYS